MITKDMIIKNLQTSTTTDKIYIMNDNHNENMSYVLISNELFNYAEIRIFIYNEKMNILTIYYFFKSEDMVKFDTAIDFWNDMSSKEKLLYLLNIIPWKIEECNFEQKELQEVESEKK